MQIVRDQQFISDIVNAVIAIVEDLKKTAEKIDVRWTR